MIRLLIFGLIIAVCLMAFMALSNGGSRRNDTIDVEPVDATSENARKNDSAEDDDIIDVEPIEQ